LQAQEIDTTLSWLHCQLIMVCVRAESQMMLQQQQQHVGHSSLSPPAVPPAPVITHTAATPQDSPNTTLETGAIGLHRLNPNISLYASSLSIDSIDRSSVSKMRVCNSLWRGSSLWGYYLVSCAANPETLGKPASLCKNQCGTPIVLKRCFLHSFRSMLFEWVPYLSRTFSALLTIFDQ
jgi:hypothetical protein